MSARNFEFLGEEDEELSAHSTAQIQAGPVQRVSENTPHVRKPTTDIPQQVTSNQG